MPAFELLQGDNIGVGLGNCSHAGVIDLRRADRVIFISGQTSHDESRGVVGVGDLPTQFERVFANLRLVIEGVGATMRDVVAFRTYLTRPEDMSIFRSMRDDYLCAILGDGPYRGNTLLVVTALGKPELLEIEALVCP